MSPADAQDLVHRMQADLRDSDDEELELELDDERPKALMLERSHIPEWRWWVVEVDDNETARLDCIHHPLSQIPYGEVEHAPIVLPERPHHDDYVRHPVPPKLVVPQVG